MNKKKLVILTGPTAVGKTELSLDLARAIDGEIISADSIQVYKHLDIGSAKIMPEEMQGIRHHLIDVLEPWENFNVSEFKKLACEAMEDIYSRNKIPIITGGTGFYIQAILYDIDFKENVDDGYRASLEKIYEEDGPDSLIKMLERTDKDALDAIGTKNIRRIIRALEYYHQTGEKISVHNERERQKVSPYNNAYFVLNCDRNILYKKIEQRIDDMISNGLVDEVKTLVENYNVNRDMVSMQGLGYKEILMYLNNEISLDDAIYILKRDTRHFAKRQLTWFRREKEVIWLNKDELTEKEVQLDFMLNELKNRNII